MVHSVLKFVIYIFTRLPGPYQEGQVTPSAMPLVGEALIENNILIDVNKVMVFRSSGAGSVVAYNYADDGWIYGTEGWVEVGLNASHMAGPHHVLFEGNYGFNADSDYTHGNAIYLTFFRNWLSGQRRDFTDIGNVRTVGLAYGSWWDLFVGNILGRPGKTSAGSWWDLFVGKIPGRRGKVRVWKLLTLP